jgi:H+-transporting ATPase
MKEETASLVATSKVNDLLQDLNTGYNGLTKIEAEKRQKENGFNEIQEKRINPVLNFLSYFWGPIPIMIEIAAILSLLIQHFADFFIIMVLLMMNTLISFWHNSKASNAIEMLKKKLSPQARVKRDSEWQTIPSRELVKGDVVRLRLGDIIPADVKIIEGDYLECDESALTGESMSVNKKLWDAAYSGAVIIRGECNAVVTSTGMNTYFGKTAKLVGEANTKSHFEKAVIRIGNFLIIMALILVAIIIVVSLFRHDNILETLRFAMILTVASIPVALPAVLTITMAIGAIKLTKKGAIVSKLASIEELAGMDILCSDKTGTLTKNQLTIGEPFTVGEYDSNEVILYAALASRTEDNDQIDKAILNKLEENQMLINNFKAFKAIKFTPFDPVVKRTEAIVTDKSGKTINVIKGAPQVVIEKCKDEINNREDIETKINEFAKMGYRVIGVACSYNNSVWNLIGFIPLFDPPRDDARETIAEAEAAGINIKMVTGDNIAIAKQISSKLGLKSNIISADKLQNMESHLVEDQIENADGFAEVFPEHKFKIVKEFQKLNHIVGMTGDGVNDAPALKAADCGIAVAGATDAAKSAASIVLTETGISTIIDALKESRKIFQRMKSYSIYRIAETVRVLFFIALSILVFNFYPVTAVMIVLLALLNDAPIIAIATDHVIYSKQPERWDMKTVLGLGTLLGIIGVFSSFFIFYLGKDVLNLQQDALQTFVFLKLAIAGHLTIFLARTKGHFWEIKPSATLLWSAVLTKIIATLFAVLGWFVTPISLSLSLFIWAYSLVAFFITDYIKFYFYKSSFVLNN